MGNNKYYDKNYMSLCSEKTLQSNDRGFFMSFVDRVNELAGEQWINSVFGKLQNDSQRIRRVYEDDAVSVTFIFTRNCSVVFIFCVR